ncbi:MAG TPA: ribbon-helix-helix protein, CopG family [Polyangia bacterium]
MTKSMTLRLPEETAANIEAVARADEMPVSKAVRDAIDAHVDKRRKDKEFKERLARMMRENQEVLDRLSK